MTRRFDPRVGATVAAVLFTSVIANAMGSTTVTVQTDTVTRTQVCLLNGEPCYADCPDTSSYNGYTCTFNQSETNMRQGLSCTANQTGRCYYSCSSTQFVISTDSPACQINDPDVRDREPAELVD